MYPILNDYRFVSSHEVLFGDRCYWIDLPRSQFLSDQNLQFIICQPIHFHDLVQLLHIPKLILHEVRYLCILQDGNNPQAVHVLMRYLKGRKNGKKKCTFIACNKHRFFLSGRVRAIVSNGRPSQERDVKLSIIMWVVLVQIQLGEKEIIGENADAK